MKAYPEAELGNLVAPHLLTLTKIKALYELAKSSKSGDVPDNLVVNHCLAENPYESLYKDEWKKKIGASKFLSHYVCITDLVRHIHDETKKSLKVQNMRMIGCFIMTHCL